MQMQYRFPRLPELASLKVVVDNTGGEIRTAISGTRSPWVWFIVKTYFLFYNRIGTLAPHKGGSVQTLYLPPIPSPAHERLFEAFLSSILLKRIIPLAATIGVTTGCQCACMHCSAKGRSPLRPGLSLDELKDAVDQCLELGLTNITFTGGEPLLKNDLEKLISRVPPEKAITLVFTNALGLSPERARSLKAAGTFGVHISLDSPDPAEHDRLRGVKGAFEAVEQGVRNALESGLLVGISTYATRQNVLNHQLAAIAELCHRWGVHEISVFDAISTGALRNNEDVTLNRRARAVLLRDSRRLNKKFRNKPRIVTQTWTNTGLGFSRFIGCLAGNWQLHLTAQGDLTPCDFTPLSFGNIKSESLASLWSRLLRHPAYKERRISCRMQDPRFRRQYIDPIPENADLPYPISLLAPE